MEITHRSNRLSTKIWVSDEHHPDFCSVSSSSSSSSSSVQVDLSISWQVEYQWMNITADAVGYIINKSVVEDLNVSLPLFDYRFLTSYQICHRTLFWVLSAMGVDANSHVPIVIRKMVEYARSKQELVSHMPTNRVLSLRAEIKLVRAHVRDERVLIDLATRESMIEHDTVGSDGRMIPATDISALRTETVSGSDDQSCTICLEELSEGSSSTVLPCSHIFHGSCILRWLKESHVCPLCRFELPTCD